MEKLLPCELGSRDKMLRRHGRSSLARILSLSAVWFISRIMHQVKHDQIHSAFNPVPQQSWSPSNNFSLACVLSSCVEWHLSIMYSLEQQQAFPVSLLQQHSSWVSYPLARTKFVCFANCVCCLMFKICLRYHSSACMCLFAIQVRADNVVISNIHIRYDSMWYQSMIRCIYFCVRVYSGFCYIIYMQFLLSL